MRKAHLKKIKIPFYRHSIGKEEINSVKKALKQPILTSGKYVIDVEKKIASYLKVKYVLCVNSCTGAIHMSLLALNIGKGDEVITTPLTFVASIAPVVQVGANPILCDVDETSGNIDADKIEKLITKKTKAILVVHLYGEMCDMKKIHSIARKYKLQIIEDSAHSFESIRDGIRPGRLSSTACFSFFATKNLTCGEGGAVATNSLRIFKKLKEMRTHGMTKTAYDRAIEGYSHYDVKNLGWKYNMSNIEASILLPQFKKIQKKLNQRQKIVNLYYKRLSNISDIKMPLRIENHSKYIHSHHLFPIWVEPKIRDNLLLFLRGKGVEVVVNYNPIHFFTFYKKIFGNRNGKYPVAERIGLGSISLPCYPGMNLKQIQIISEVLESFFNISNKLK
jgi:dTDP-4-amino-4,6-dideoxygalactose transaminase